MACLVCQQVGHDGNGCPQRLTICLTCGESDTDHHTIWLHAQRVHDSGRIQRIDKRAASGKAGRLGLARTIEAAHIAKRQGAKS